MADLKQDKRKQILDQLNWDNRLEIKDLEVEVLDGRLTMRGSVPSYNSMRAAEESAYVIPGIHQVDNDLVINYPDDITVPTDEDIRSTVATSLEWNNNLASNQVEVSVDDGVVSLTGAFDKFWKKRLAEDIAYSTTGVIAVENKIKIRPKEDVVDEVIARDIHSALDRNYQVDVNSIEVKVENGIVFLSGEVPDFNAARAAEISAQHANGVSEVRNQVVIKKI